MNLPIELISYQIKKIIPYLYYQENCPNLLLGRPRFLSEISVCNNQLIIADSNELLQFPYPLNSVLILCLGEPKMSEAFSRCNMLVFDEAVNKHFLFNVLQEIYDKFDFWEQQLKEICYNGQSFSDLIDCCDSIIASPVALMDDEFTYVAYSKQRSKELGLEEQFVEQANRLPLESVNEIISNPDYHTLEKKIGVFEFEAGQHILCHNIRNRENTYVGRITAMYNPETSSYDSKIISILAGYIQQLYELYLSFFFADTSLNRLHNMLENSLNHEPVSEEYINMLLAELGWRAEDQYELLIFHPNHRYDKTMYARYLCPQLERQWPGGCAVSRSNSIILLQNITVYTMNSKHNFYQELAYFLRESLLTASISRRFGGLQHIHTARLQADIAMELGLKNNPTLWYYSFDDYAYEYLLNHGPGEFSPTQICHTGLLRLLEHDRKSGTSYYLTLHTYCATQYNASAAASALFIHRSTFLDRMARIHELAPIDFTSWNTRLYVLLSFQLLETRSEN